MQINRINGSPELTELTSIVSRFKACQGAENVMRSSALEDLLYMGYVPPTKWQRRKYKIAKFFGRFNLAWRALRGDELEFED